MSDVTWVAYANAGYIDFARNFHAALVKYNVRLENLTVFCTDAESFRELSKLFHCERVEVADITDELTNWGELRYKRMMFLKLDILRHAMKRFDSRYIAYCDLDVLFFKNPTQLMLNELQRYDIVGQCDAGLVANPCRPGCPHLCAGLMAFRNEDRMLRMLHYDPQWVSQLSSDQPVINHYIQNKVYTAMHLPRELFPNGSYVGFSIDTAHKNFTKIPEDAYVLHFNYLYNHQKVEAMKAAGLWLID